MSDISQHLQTLLITKKYSLQHLLELLKQFLPRQFSYSLQIKSILILNMTKYFLKVTQNWLKELKKTKFDICQAPFRSQDKRQRSTTAKKARPRQEQEKEISVQGLSINNILEEIEEKNRHQISASAQNHLMTPMKQPTFGQNQQAVTIPPFEADIIAQLSAQMNSQIPSQKSFGSDQWQPDLKEYQNVLALTQKGIPLTTNTKKLNRTRITTVVKSKIQDKQIEVTQGDEFIRQLELLTTKTKITKKKQLENQHYFTLQITTTNSILTNLQAYVQKIKNHQLSNLSIFNDFDQTHMVSLPIFIPHQSDRIDNQPFFVNEQNNPSITEELQNTIREKLNQEFFMKKTVSLNEFGQKYKVKKEAKGELFFQLLHMDFKLTQSSPQTFGDILICQH